MENNNYKKCTGQRATTSFKTKSKCVKSTIFEFYVQYQAQYLISNVHIWKQFVIQLQIIYFRDLLQEKVEEKVEEKTSMPDQKV